MNDTVSIIIPIHNEAGSLDELCLRLTKTLEECKKGYEIIFVDDGSKDRSVEILKKNQDSNSRVKILKLKGNYGQHIALFAGIKHAKGDILIFMDGDLQNEPEDIPKFIKKIEEGFDYVSGWRVIRDDHVLRKIPSFIFNKMICKVTGVTLRDYNCAFKAVKRDIIGDPDSYGEMIKFFPAWMAKLADSVCEIQVGHKARMRGESKYHFFKMVELAADFITNYTIKPFRIIGVSGVILFLFSILSGMLYMLARAFSLITPLPTIIIILIIAFFMGFQCLTVGFMGEYLIRIHQLLQRKTLFEIERIIEK